MMPKVLSNSPNVEDREKNLATYPFVFAQYTV